MQKPGAAPCISPRCRFAPRGATVATTAHAPVDVEAVQEDEEGVQDAVVRLDGVGDAQVLGSRLRERVRAMGQEGLSFAGTQTWRNPGRAGLDAGSAACPPKRT